MAVNWNRLYKQSGCCWVFQGSATRPEHGRGCDWSVLAEGKLETAAAGDVGGWPRARFAPRLGTGNQIRLVGRVESGSRGCDTRERGSDRENQGLCALSAVLPRNLHAKRSIRNSRRRTRSLGTKSHTRTPSNQHQSVGLLVGLLLPTRPHRAATSQLLQTVFLHSTQHAFYPVLLCQRPARQPSRAGTGRHLRLVVLPTLHTRDFGAQTQRAQLSDRQTAR